MNRKVRGVIFLLMAALVWGLSFIVIQGGLEYMGTFLYTGIRSIVAAIVLIVILKFFPKISNLGEPQKQNRNATLERKAGVVCGILLFVATNIHQIGISQTTSGKAGFITTLYIIIIPILLFLRGEKIKKSLIICIIFATIGFYFLSIDENFKISRGDILVLIASILISIHSIFLSKYAKLINAFRLNAYQTIISGLISLVFAFFLEEININIIKEASLNIFYMAILSSVIAYSLQIIAFSDITPSLGMMIVSLESIISAIGGYIILGDILNKREVIGCIIVFISIIGAQIINIPKENLTKISKIFNK